MTIQVIKMICPVAGGAITESYKRTKTRLLRNTARGYLEEVIQRTHIRASEDGDEPTPFPAHNEDADNHQQPTLTPTPVRPTTAQAIRQLAWTPSLPRAQPLLSGTSDSPAPPDPTQFSPQTPFKEHSPLKGRFPQDFKLSPCRPATTQPPPSLP